MRQIKIGQNVEQKEGFKAFTPNPFPPKEGFLFEPEILKKNNEASRLLGKLDGITKLLPDSDFFLLMYLRKDAASSSQIEGTMATMIDAIEAEVRINTNTPEDVSDILQYIKALNYGMERVTTGNFPISLRFIRELHYQLMHKARATHFSDPGEFRKSQNWIGGTRPDNAKFVPPAVQDMHRALSDLETFIHSDDTVPTIIKAGLVHAQFETIHPFLDGNGRTGRMLITFYLWKEGYLEKPVLFLSSFFKKHQQLYYEKLSGYHNGYVHDWIDFFLDAVIEIANEAIDSVGKITDLRQNDMLKIQRLGKRSSESAALILPKLYRQPIVDANLIQKWTGFTRAGAQTVIDRFIDMGILSPKDNDKKYGQSYIYRDYIGLFYKGPLWTPFQRFHTDLLPPFEKPFTAQLQFKVWSEDNTIPLLIRIAATKDGDYSNMVTGPSAVVQQLITEKQVFYISVPHPYIKWGVEVDVDIKGFKDPYL